MSEQLQEQAATIPCRVALGMFSDERGVEITLPDGRKIAALVDKRDVTVEREPEPGQTVPGRLRVSIIEQQDETVWIDLPQPSFSAGQRFQVPRRLLGSTAA